MRNDSEYETLEVLLFNFTKETPKKRMKYDIGLKGTCFFMKLLEYCVALIFSTIRFGSSSVVLIAILLSDVLLIHLSIKCFCQ